MAYTTLNKMVTVFINNISQYSLLKFDLPYNILAST